MSLKHKISTASRNKIFVFGLALRILLILLFFPEIQADWFVPFIVSIIESPSLMPWQTFLSEFNNTEAFPYGPIMALTHLPFVFIGWIFNNIFSSDIFTLIGFKISLLVADILLLLILVKMFGRHYREVLLFYWLSPIVIYVTYIHGQTDIVPISLFTASLLYLKHENIKKSAILLGISISAKFSMLIAAPFLFLYLIVNKKYRCFSHTFVFWLLLTTVLIQAPFLFDSGFHTMVLGNARTERLFWISINFFDGVTPYVTPFILLLILYFVWRQSKINFNLLMAILPIVFFAIILTGTPPPGWYIWLTPFLVAHQIRHGKSSVILVSAFSAAIVGFYTLTASNGTFIPLNLDFEEIRQYLQSSLTDKSTSFLFTLLFGLGFITMIQVARSGIKENNYFHLNNKTLSIGISGGMGSGKHSLSHSIMDLFGRHSTCNLSGNNYHKWDKFSPFWKTITPLNPRANLLMKFTNDALELIQKRNITSCLYNEKSGFFSTLQEIKSNDVLLVSGFHTLFTEHLRKQLDLKIFIDIDEKLRHYFDQSHNNVSHTEYLETNINRDTTKYIDCQKKYADIIFHLEPLNPDDITDSPDTIPQLKLKTTIRNGVYYGELQRAFIGLCNLHTNLELTEEIGTATLEIEGELEFKAGDASLAIHMICPQIIDILDIKPKWLDGMMGIMQVIVLAGINQALQEQK